MRFIGKFVAWVGASLMMAGIFGFIAAALVFQHYSEDLPSFEKLAEYSPPVVTRLYAADGRLLAEYAKEKRIFVPLKAIPTRVIQAFIAAEDKNFYDHQGIDIYGIARAVTENIANYGSGRSMVGGSTITQQVVKNFLLTNEKSFERKIKEAILAYRISKVYSKDKILELYLNEIYLGNGSYGVAAAALNYFNKSLDELTTEEAALLAAMPKAPSSYSPERNYEAAIKRRNYVIGRMLDDGYIDSVEAQRATMTPIEMEARSPDEIARADFFAEEVRRSLASMYGSNVLYEGGLTVKTTVNPELQTYADKALRNALMDYDRRFGYRGPVMQLKTADNWEVALPEATAKLEVPLYDDQHLAIVTAVENNKATVGLPDASKGTIALDELTWARKDLPGLSRGTEIKKAQDVLGVGDIVIVEPVEKVKKAEKEEAEEEGAKVGAQAEKNIAYKLLQVPEVNGAMVVMDPHTGRVLAMAGGYSYIGSEFNRATQAKRQPGSAFKPFVYMTALENGFTPSTIILDEPIELPQGPGLPMWRPQNYGGEFLGPTTLRQGLEKSRNTMTVRLAQIVGLGRIIEMVSRLGVYHGDIPRNYSMVLGAAETTLLDMVTGYAQIANGGRKVEASIIERIDDRDGVIVFRRDNRECKGCELDQSAPVAMLTPPEIEDTREVVIDPRIAYQMTSLLEGVVQRGTATRAKAVGKPLGGKTGTTNDSRDVWFIGFSPDLVAGVYIGYDQPRTLGGKETGGKVALPAFVSFMTDALKDEPATPFRIPPGIMMVDVDRQTGLPPYAGVPTGQTITESFVVGGPIFRPASAVADANKAKQEDALENYDTMQSGFDPYAGWEDSNHYMSPQKAQWQDQKLRQDTFRDDGTGVVGADPRQPGNRSRPLDNPSRYRPPAPQYPSQQPARGYDVYTQPQQNERQAPAYNSDNAASQGTGGLY